MYDISNMKAYYKFAGTVFEIESHFDYFGKFAKDYMMDSDEFCRHHLKVSLGEIEEWKATHEDAKGFPLDYLETLVIHSKVATILADENKFIFHGSCIAVDQYKNSYLFAAPSGVGKSTHVKLLKKMYGDRIKYINDDKPFVFNDNGIFYVFGSPWNGKERISNNVEGILNGVFVVSRSNTNKVSKLSPKEAINHLIKQFYIPQGITEAINATNTLIKICEELPIYLLEVNMEDGASKVSFDIMSKGVN